MLPANLCRELHEFVTKVLMWLAELNSLLLPLFFHNDTHKLRGLDPCQIF